MVAGLRKKRKRIDQWGGVRRGACDLLFIPTKTHSSTVKRNYIRTLKDCSFILLQFCFNLPALVKLLASFLPASMCTLCRTRFLMSTAICCHLRFVVTHVLWSLSRFYLNSPAYRFQLILKKALHIKLERPILNQ